MKAVPILHTARCVLSEIRKENMNTLREIVEDEQFQRFLPELYTLVNSNEGLNHFVTTFDKYLSQGDGVLWGIHKDKSLIGFAALMDLTYEPCLFYALHPDYRYQGLAKESIMKVVEYFMVASPNHFIQTEVHVDNKASISILKSCGFKELLVKDGKMYLACIS